MNNINDLEKLSKFHQENYKQLKDIAEISKSLSELQKLVPKFTQPDFVKDLDKLSKEMNKSSLVQVLKKQEKLSSQLLTYSSLGISPDKVQLINNINFQNFSCYSSNLLDALNKTSKLLNNDSISILGKAVTKLQLIDYLDEIKKYPNFNSLINNTGFSSTDELETNLDKTLEELASINDKQPLSECELNSKTLQKYKNLPPEAKSKVIRNYVYSIVIVLDLFFKAFFNTGSPINFNLAIGSTNTTFNNDTSKNNNSDNNTNINISILSKDTTYNYSTVSSDDVASPSSIGENTIQPSELISNE